MPSWLPKNVVGKWKKTCKSGDILYFWDIVKNDCVNYSAVTAGPEEFAGCASFTIFNVADYGNFQMENAMPTGVTEGAILLGIFKTHHYSIQAKRCARFF